MDSGGLIIMGNDKWLASRYMSDHCLSLFDFFLGTSSSSSSSSSMSSRSP